MLGKYLFRGYIFAMLNTSAQTIADDILKLAKRRRLEFTPMQLMKLVYIAYGWHLAMTGKPLFLDRIEAWKYGPVIPNLYHATKRFGRDPIPHPLISDSELSRPKLEAFLDSIVENYGSYSGIALSNLTHRIGTPWQQVYQVNKLGIRIPDDLIKEHYQRGLDARQRAAASA